MITKCDQYWWQQNKSYLIILFCTLPAAVLLPAASLLIIIIFLYGTCDKFLVFHSCFEKQDDSMRFILAMPFSREQIFSTYIKGFTLTSLAYVVSITLIRVILMVTKLSRVFFWNGNIDTGIELFNYTSILLTAILITCIFLICLVDNYTISEKSTYISLSLIVVMPLLYILMFLKSIIMSVTGAVRMKMGVTYDVSEIKNMGITEKSASFFSVIILTALIIVLFYTLTAVIAKQRKKYVQGVRKWPVR